MCTVSMIGDDWQRRIPEQHPWVQPSITILPAEVSRFEFDALRAEVQELIKLLKAAKAFDAATGQPDCENDEKVGLIKRLAGLLDVDLDDLFI